MSDSSSTPTRPSITPTKATPTCSAATRPMSRRCTKPTSTTPAACPTTGARTSTRCRTCPPPTARNARDVAARRRSSNRLRRSAPRPGRLQGGQGQRRRSRGGAASRSHVQSLIAAYRFARRALGRPRSAEAHRAPADPRARAGVLRPHRSRHGHRCSTPRNTYFGKETDDAARDPAQRAARDLLRHHRRRVHVHHRPGARSAGGSRGSRAIRTKPSFSAEQKKHILDRLTAAEGLERYPAHQVRRPEALLARRRRELHRLDGRADPARRRQGRAGDRDRHGAPRPPERAGQHRSARCRRTCSPSSTTRRAEDLPAGDVKYHQGFSSDVSTPGGPVHLSLAFNPSHLEIVNPVVEGSVQARAWTAAATRKATQVLPVLVHGDAAFAGQGVVMETLALAQTRGYYTGGTVHIVINNQIGFTTSDPRDSALDAVLHRRRQDDRGAGAARERRRSRSGGARARSSRSTSARSSTRTWWSTSSASASSATTSRTRRR